VKPGLALRWAAAVLLGLAVFQGQAEAKLRRADPWEQASPDGRFLLVMIPDEKFVHPDDRANVQALRAIYPHNGVYRNDGSRELLWKGGPYCYQGSVYFSSDGQHVVVSGCSPLDMIAFAFLAADREPKYIALYEQVPFEHLKSRLSLRFIYLGRDQFNPDTLIYTVWSEAGERFTFDVRTGELRDVSSPWHRCVIEGLAFLAAIAAVLVWWLIRRRQDAKEKGLPD
jgi:hypothetical protein